MFFHSSGMLIYGWLLNNLSTEGPAMGVHLRITGIWFITIILPAICGYYHVGMEGGCHPPAACVYYVLYRYISYLIVVHFM